MSERGIKELAKESLSPFIREIKGVRENTLFTDLPNEIMFQYRGFVPLLSETGVLSGFCDLTLLNDKAPRLSDARKKISIHFEENQSFKKAYHTLLAENLPFAPVKNAEGKTLGLVTIFDLMNPAAKAAEETADCLNQTQKQLAARDEFLEVVVHDIRSPLGVIQVCVDFLEAQDNEEGTLSAEQKDFLSRIKRNSTKALNLVGDLLDLGRLHRGVKLNKKAVSIGPYLNEITDGLVMVAEERGLTIRVKIERPENIFVDRDRFAQIIDNFIGNAIKFSPQGGEITVFSEKAEREGKSYIKIGVKDEGSGIPSDKLNSIFDKYQQLDNVEATKLLGVGLGLTIAQQFAKLHGALIEVESEEEKGTTFSVLLPYDEELSQETLATPVNLTQTKKRVLVVDDDEDIRTFTKESLEEAGYLVFTAENGSQAISVFEHTSPEMVVSDIKMPDMDGIELLQRIKVMGDVPFVFTSGFFVSITEDMAKSVFKAEAILTKPFEAADLQGAVARTFKKIAEAELGQNLRKVS